MTVGLIGFFSDLLAARASVFSRASSAIILPVNGEGANPGDPDRFLARPAVARIAIVFFIAIMRATVLPMAIPIIVISFCGMQFFTNVGNGAWWPLLVDIVPENRRGTASGIQGFFTFGSAAVGGIVGITVLNQNGQTRAALWHGWRIFALTGIVNAVVIRGKDKPAEGVHRSH